MKEYIDFQDVLLMPDVYSNVDSRSKPDIPSDGIVPLSIANMENVGTLKVAKIASAYGWKTYIDKHTPIREWKEFFSTTKRWEEARLAIPTLGFTESDLLLASELSYLITNTYGIRERTICFDVANGHVLKFWKMMQSIISKINFEHVVFGNLANPNTVHKLIDFLDTTDFFINVKTLSVKMGIGSGSVCTTRLMTGVGVPQYTLIKDTSMALDMGEHYSKNKKIRIISDGGIRTPGDVVKAFAAGADEVMMGGMFAGLKETGTTFYGSSSDSSMSYNKENKYSTPEGKKVIIDRNMTVEERILQIEGGLRSAMTYLDCETINDLKQMRRQIILVRRQVDNYQ